MVLFHPGALACIQFTTDRPPSAYGVEVHCQSYEILAAFYLSESDSESLFFKREDPNLLRSQQGISRFPRGLHTYTQQPISKRNRRMASFWISRCGDKRDGVFVERLGHGRGKTVRHEYQYLVKSNVELIVSL